MSPTSLHIAVLLSGLAAIPAAGNKEIKALQATVATQAARLQVLEQSLRTGVCLAPAKSGGSKLKGSEACTPLDVDPEPELAAFRAAERRRAAAKKQELLTTVFNVSVGKPITALAISSGLLDNKGVPRVVAAADTSGTLHIFERTGALALSLPPSSETSASIISSIVIGPKEDPFVAAGTVGGEVTLYNLSLPRVRNAPSPLGSSPPAPPTTAKLAMRAPAQLDEHGQPVAILSMETYMRARKTMLAVGDASGALRLLFRNGTPRTAMPIGGAVRAIERNKEGVFLGVAADGKGLQLYDQGRGTNAPIACEGGAEGDEAAEGGGAPVVSIAWDVQLPQLVYAGTAAGDIRIYNSKARSRQLGGKYGNESRMATACKLVTVIRGHEAAEVQLAPLKGYLVSVASRLLVTHNVTGLYSRTRDDPFALVGRTLPAGAEASAAPLVAGARQGHVVVGAGASGELTLLASKLVFKEEPKDGGSFGLGALADTSSGGPAWLLRNPLVLGVIMMVVFWQTNKHYKGNDGGGGKGGAGGLDADMLRTLEAMRAGGGGGGDLGDLSGLAGLGGARGGRGGGGSSRIEEIDSK